MRLLIIGPPGSGKGTQAVQIAEKWGIPAISTGDLFRANVASNTAMGRVAREYIEAGEYVPDQVTNTMVRDRLADADCAAGFLLDGYPRTLRQVAELDAVLDATGSRLSAVIELAVDHDVLVDRLLLRAQAQGRVDDSAAVIRRRQEVYLEQTSPLTGHYDELGLLHRVDGDGTIEMVTSRIAAELTGVPAEATV